MPSSYVPPSAVLVMLAQVQMAFETGMAHSRLSTREVRLICMIADTVRKVSCRPWV